ncbi:OLC1v1001685C1 [Oldenlandia corymbosa var. corymbosa]|uniref:OLC1v1001685C1 n=1 Tax=Oldenlandia corymbosa var. corymbosa TaxID=529605 RepID=A0AAV1D7G3_OLDCO|nr:OLC1v1001685C1 [Oldenlandia corymbosa var. corymbosa]
MVGDVRNLLKKKDLEHLEEKFSLTKHDPTLPEGRQWANTPPLGKITVYAKYFELGLHLPVLSFIRDILDAYGLPLAQLTPNFITSVLTFIHVCHKVEVVPDVFLFGCFHKLVRGPKNFPSWLSFTKNQKGPKKELAMPSEGSKPRKNEYKTWKAEYLYINSSLADLPDWNYALEGDKILDPWSTSDQADLTERQPDLDKLVSWTESYSYLEIAAMSDAITNSERESQSMPLSQQDPSAFGGEKVVPSVAVRDPLPSNQQPPTGPASKHKRPALPSEDASKRVRFEVTVTPISTVVSGGLILTPDDLLKETYTEKDPRPRKVKSADIPRGTAFVQFKPPQGVVQTAASFGRLIHNYVDLGSTNENMVARLTEELQGVRSELDKAKQEAQCWKDQLTIATKALTEKAKAYEESMKKVKKECIPKTSLGKLILAALRVYLQSSYSRHRDWDDGGSLGNPGRPKG